MKTEWKHGFRNDVPSCVGDSYPTVVTYEYPIVTDEGNEYTVCVCFPPIGREDTYGGKSVKELLPLALVDILKTRRLHGLWGDDWSDKPGIENIRYHNLTPDDCVELVGRLGYN